MRSRLVSGIALISLLAVSIAIGLSRRPPPSALEAPLGPPILDPTEQVAYVCPIHPDYTSPVAGTCPRDGMSLVQANPYDPRDYEVELTTSPDPVRAGEAATLQLRVRHPGTAEQIRDFVMVHDRRYHLFVIGQDMRHFEHLHPASAEDGTWSLEVTLPEEGYYKLLSDFVPHGGSAQFVAHPIVTAGYEGDLASDAARLVPGPPGVIPVGGLTATVTQDPPTFVAGLYGHLSFMLSEAGSGRPVTDLEPYLGSFGHIMILSEDLVHSVHSHPLDLRNSDEETGPLALMLPMGADPSTLRAGPEITFEGLMPKPGLYRAWAQFRHDGQVHTFPYTFAVEASE